MIGVTTAIIHDKRIKRKDNTFAVKLRITHQRNQRYYPLNVHLTESEWDKVYDTKSRKKYKDYNIFFGDIEHRAIMILQELHPFSFTSFERKFNFKTKNSNDAILSMGEYIVGLNDQLRTGTAASYSNALNSFKKYLASKGRKKLNFWDITADWLNQYEKWMVVQGNSLTSVGIYLRSLRTIVNIAIENGNLDKESYPFGKRKYQIPSGQNVKKALKISDIKKIVQYKPVTESEQRARDFWVFSYLCNGANVKDIVRLKYQNIDNRNITFTRAKTERSAKQNHKLIVIVLLPEIQKIIHRWGIKPIKPETYVFGLISKEDSPEKQLAKTKQVTKNINKYMKKIGEKLEIDMKITTYSARHSFATILKRSGAPTAFISDSLGHKDLRTTENYLDSFESSVKESYQKKLLNFDNE
jgi:integrase/recombinase XerD